MSHATRPPVTADEKTIKALLAAYACPVPFHEVRTRFLGGIASPGLLVSPLDVVKNLGITIQRGFFDHGFFRHVTPQRP